jgi:hypothetical protein
LGLSEIQFVCLQVSIFIHFLKKYLKFPFNKLSGTVKAALRLSAVQSMTLSRARATSGEDTDVIRIGHSRVKHFVAKLRQAIPEPVLVAHGTVDER